MCFHSVPFPSQVSNKHSFSQELNSKELLLNFKFNVMYILGILLFNHSHLEVFIVPFVCVLYVSISLYPWYQIHRKHKSCSALETEQEVLYHRGDMVQKTIVYNHLQVQKCITRAYFIYSAHFETSQLASWQQGAAAATADQSRFQMISRGNTDYFTLVFQGLHLTIQSYDSVNLLGEFIALYPILDYICSGFNV